ncbi:MAG: hypothetical protein HN509_16395 [Halobacteriovoraceae bacterium]|jgi:hypothetical protein|nr:hypothetical protein [Halobacteriovoraceae bacterium]MBT5093943.1 hypothetical protein [Halobacteriovoraceae bacterium]
MDASFESSAPKSRLQKAVERNRAKQARRGSTSPAPPKKSWSLPKRPTRKSVARAGDVEFEDTSRPALRSRARATGNVSYQTASSPPARKRYSAAATNAASKSIDFLIKGIWIFAFILILRLIFSGGGVLDYYHQQKAYQEKLGDFTSIGIENQELVIENEKIRHNKRFQKKLVRDHLGFIASDEFLILFPKGKGKKSI